MRAGVESRRGQSAPAAVFLRRCPGGLRPGVLAADVLRPPDARACPDEASALAASTFSMDPGKKRAVVLARAVTPAVADAGMQAQRGEVDHEQDERGQDQADDAGCGEGDEQDGQQEPGVVVLLHDPDDKRR